MKKLMAIAIGSVLVGGVAFAAYQGISNQDYAQVLSSTPVNVTEPVFADLVAVQPVSGNVSVPRERCEDRVVERRQPERFGDKDGMVVGAIVGGLLGNQVGSGNGRKAATVAGAVGGAFAGREIDRRHQGGQRYSATERQCQTVNESQTKVVGYEVKYRLNGEVASMRVPEQPLGPQIQVGERDKVIGYDVEWEFEGRRGQVRLPEEPGEKLPIKDGVIETKQG